MRGDGSYSYYSDYRRIPLNYDGRPGESDVSNTQTGVLAVGTAQDAGIEIYSADWSTANDYWCRTQRPDGTWIYSDWEKHPPPPLNMTSAGLASLYITTECTDLDPPRLEDAAIHSWKRP